MILLSGCHSTVTECSQFPEPPTGIYNEICSLYDNPEACFKDKPKTFEWLQRLYKAKQISEIK